MRVRIVIICLVLSIIDSYAQNQWSFRECVDFAIKNNIDLKLQELNVRAGEIDLEMSKNSRLPDLKASASQVFNFGRTTSYNTNGFEANNSSNTRLDATSSVPIFTGFRISNDIKAKKFSLDATIEGLNKAKDNLELQIASYYLDILLKKEILKIYQEQVLLTQKQEMQTRLLVESGKIAMSQLYDIIAQLAKDESSVVMAENDLNNTILILGQALNLKSIDNFDIEDPYFRNDVLAENSMPLEMKTPDQIYQISQNIKPQVKEALYLIESSKKNLKVAQSNYWPTLDFSMGINTALQRVYGRNNFSFSDQFKNNRSEYFAFNLSIPVFNRFETRNRVRKARLEIQSREFDLMNIKQSLYKEIQQAHQSAINASVLYLSAKKSYEAAYESFRYAEERYRVGKMTVFEYNEAQTKLTKSLSEQLKAKYDFLFRTKILDFYQGKAIEI